MDRVDHLPANHSAIGDVQVLRAHVIRLDNLYNLFDLERLLCDNSHFGSDGSVLAHRGRQTGLALPSAVQN